MSAQHNFNLAAAAADLPLEIYICLAAFTVIFIGVKQRDNSSIIFCYDFEYPSSLSLPLRFPLIHRLLFRLLHPLHRSLAHTHYLSRFRSLALFVALSVFLRLAWSMMVPGPSPSLSPSPDSVVQQHPVIMRHAD